MSVKLWVGAGAAVALLVAAIAWGPNADAPVRATAARSVEKAVETRPRVAAPAVAAQSPPVADVAPVEPTTALVVVARTFRDEPVAGAVVELHRDKPAPATDMTQTADDDGVARFARVPAGDWFIVARADGFADAGGDVRLAPPCPERRTVLYLDPGHEVRGFVRGASGALVPGATVEGGGRGGAKRRAVADASGAYVLTGLPTGEVTLRAGRTRETMLGMGTLVAIPVVATCDLTVMDLPRVSVTGTVIDDATGAPVEGATVRIGIDEYTGPTCVTGADGRFRVDGLWREFLEALIAVKPGYLRAPVTRASPDADGALVRELRLRRGASVEGTVTTPDGPLDAAEVTLTSPNPFRAVARTTVRTDATGRYVFEGAAAGLSQVYAEAPGYIAQTPNPGGASETIALRNAKVPETGVVRVDLVLVKGAVVEGRVVDADGAAVPDAYVYGARVNATADGQGAFRIVGVKPGASVQITAMPAGFLHGDATVDVGPGTTSGVVIRVTRCPTVRGRLVARDGRAIENARVLVVSSKSGDPARIGNEQAAGPFPVLADGTFEGRTPEDASSVFSVVAWTSSHAPVRSAPVAVVRGQTEYDVEVALVPGATIRGRVLADGHGAAGARVTFGFAGFGYTAPPVRAVADAAGAFVVEHVAFARDASVHATASLPGYADAEADLTADAPGELVLERPLTIEGVVETRDHAPVAGVHVAAHVLELARGAPDTTASFVFTGADGRFRIERLRPGRYLVIATPRGAPRVKVADPVAAGTWDLRIVVD